MFNKENILTYIKKDNLRPLIFILALTVIFMLGIDLRARYTHSQMSINTVSFFYKRALYLYREGSYLPKSHSDLTGYIGREDYPPFLAYFAVGSYNLTNWIHGLSFYQYIAYLPLLLYCLIFLSGIYIITKLFSPQVALIFACLYALMPVAVRMTVIGYYTPEALGVMLTLLSLYFLIESERRFYFTYWAIICSTLLILTWQLFIVFFVIVLVRLAIHFRSPSQLKRHLLILSAPFLLAHLISIYIIKIDYSPLYILKEIYLGFIYSKTEDYAIALYRAKLRPLNFRLYLDNFGYFGVIFLPFGILECLKNIKEGKYYIFLFGFLLTLLLLSIYIKYRMIALPFLLVVCSIGGSYIYRAIAANLNKR